MALIACQECKHEVSTEAKTCPNCGAKVRPPKKPMSSTMKVLLGLLGVGFLASVMVDGNKKDESRRAEEERVASMTPEQRENEKAARAKRDTQLQMAGAGALTIKKAMKDPEAFELKSLVVKPNGTACYEYRAKNSFGAIFPGSAVLSSNGKLLTQEKDGNSFVTVWNKECTPAGGDEIAGFVKRLGIL
jgi:hypothetical protein